MKKHSFKEFVQERDNLTQTPPEKSPPMDEFMQDVYRQITQHKQLLERLKDA